MQNYLHPVDKQHVRLLYVFLAFVVSILYDVFFWKQSVGLGFVFFLLFFHVGFFILIHKTRQIRMKHSLFLLLPIFTMVLDVIIFNNDLVVLFIPIFICFLTFIYTVLITLQNPNKYPFHLTSIPLIRSIDLPIIKWKHIISDLFSWGEGTGKKMALGLAVSVPFLFVFTLLFINADAIFAEWIKNFNIGENSWRIFRTLVLTLFISSIFYSVIHESHSLLEKKGSVGKIDYTVIGIFLGLINLLFALFVFIQIKYLFGNFAYVLKSGITFADYARRGFFQLATVIILTTIILLVTYRSQVYYGTKKLLSFLQILLITQVGVIAGSALRRMHLYQDAYGFTVLRLYVEWFIYFTIAILVLSGICLLIRLPFKKYFHILLISGVVALTVVSSVNVDYLIGKENVSRFVNKGKQIDFDYLNKLSIDVIPALQPLWAEDVFGKLNYDQMVQLGTIISNDAFNTTITGSEFNFGKIKALKSLAEIPSYATIKMLERVINNRQYINQQSNIPS